MTGALQRIAGPYQELARKVGVMPTTLAACDVSTSATVEEAIAAIRHKVGARTLRRAIAAGGPLAAHTTILRKLAGLRHEDDPPGTPQRQPQPADPNNVRPVKVVPYKPAGTYDPADLEPRQADCNHCGESLRAEARFCTNCGEKRGTVPDADDSYKLEPHPGADADPGPPEDEEGGGEQPKAPKASASTPATFTAAERKALEQHPAVRQAINRGSACTAEQLVQGLVATYPQQARAYLRGAAA